jgi:hypothetical protein
MDAAVLPCGGTATGDIAAAQKRLERLKESFDNITSKTGLALEHFKDTMKQVSEALHLAKLTVAIYATIVIVRNPEVQAPGPGAAMREHLKGILEEWAPTVETEKDSSDFGARLPVSLVQEARNILGMKVGKESAEATVGKGREEAKAKKAPTRGARPYSQHSSKLLQRCREWMASFDEI